MAIEQTTRTNAASLIPTEHAREIIKEVAEGSSFLRMGRRLPDLSAKVREQPVLSSLAMAYFVNGDTGQKKTTHLEWDKVTLTAEEIAVIVPVSEAVLADAQYDIWAEVRPTIVEAFGRVIDAAIYYGTNKPASWPTGIVPAAVAAGNAITAGTGADLYDDLLGVGGVVALVEEDGYTVNGHVGAIQLRAQMRGLRSDNLPVFTTVPGGETGGLYALDGDQIIFPHNGAVDPASSLLISGDWTKAVYAIRQDMSFKLFDQGVIQDTDNSIALNLMQQDAVALRVVMRLGWALPKPINRINPAATAFPFAVLLP